jgi:hypothetical protein
VAATYVRFHMSVLTRNKMLVGHLALIFVLASQHRQASTMPPVVTSHNYIVFESVLRIETNVETHLITDLE